MMALPTEAPAADGSSGAKEEKAEEQDASMEGPEASTAAAVQQSVDSPAGVLDGFRRYLSMLQPVLQSMRERLDSSTQRSGSTTANQVNAAMIRNSKKGKRRPPDCGYGLDLCVFCGFRGVNGFTARWTADAVINAVLSIDKCH